MNVMAMKSAATTTVIVTVVQTKLRVSNRDILR